MIRIGLLKKDATHSKGNHRDMIIHLPTLRHLILADSYFWWDFLYKHYKEQYSDKASLEDLKHLLTLYLKQAILRIKECPTDSNANNFLLIPFDLSDQYEAGLLVQKTNTGTILLGAGSVMTSSYGGLAIDKIIRQVQAPRLRTVCLELSPERFAGFLRAIPTHVQILEDDWTSFFWPE